jgi:membrane-associated phospholipid phosphatase
MCLGVMERIRRPGAVLFVLITLAPERAAAGADDDSPSPPLALEQETASTAKKSVPGIVFEALFAEARRYLTDGAAFITAPGSWDKTDWARAGFVGLTVGTLFLADESVDSSARRHRSDFTDRVSGATTWIGGGRGFYIPFVLLGAGWASRDTNVRDTGRDAIEACIFSSLLTKGVKNTAGRERPFEFEGETTFHPFSSHDSFPSGHTTQAFAIASVVAMRSEGWVIPTLAYTAATVVAADRINDNVHFASDVAAGAIIGTVTGRFLVARHREIDAATALEKVQIEILPIPSGLSARVRF